MADISRQSRSETDETAHEQALGLSNPAHKFVTGVGVTLLAASIGTLLFDAFTGKDTPPDIVLHIEKVQPQPSGNFVVLFRAENNGGSTAADVSVKGEIQDAGGNRETSEATLDYVPAHSNRRGGLFFDSDPRQARLELRATSFQEP